MMTCGCARINGVWCPCRNHSPVSAEVQVEWLNAEVKRLELQVDALKKQAAVDIRVMGEISEARDIAFRQIDEAARHLEHSAKLDRSCLAALEVLRGQRMTEKRIPPMPSLEGPEPTLDIEDQMALDRLNCDLCNLPGMKNGVCVFCEGTGRVKVNP